MGRWKAWPELRESAMATGRGQRTKLVMEGKIHRPNPSTVGLYAPTAGSPAPMVGSAEVTWI
jgi:hypothetical protein